MKKVCILDYGSGNVQSLKVSINFLDIDCKVSNLKKDIKNATHVLLPGVGSYKKAFTKLKKKFDIDFLNQQIVEKGKCFLGICVGMQILSTTGSEHGLCNGLNWIPGTVSKIKSKNLILPHVGWNEVKFKQKNRILTNDEITSFLENVNDISLSSDAFFPFRDNIDYASRYGVKYIVHPGGSIQDDNVKNACDEYDMVMALSGKRLFLH